MKKNNSIDSDEQLKESISVVMDGEAGEFELERVLSNLEHDEVREHIKKYNHIGGTLRKEKSASFLHMDISKEVAAQIASEPLPENAHSKEKTRFFDNLFGSLNLGQMAVAASVTFAVIMGIRIWDDGVIHNMSSVATVERHETSSLLPDSTEKYAEKNSVHIVRAGSLSSIPGAVSQTEEAAHINLESYMMYHVEEAASGGVQGMLPFVRIMSFKAAE